MSDKEKSQKLKDRGQEAHLKKDYDEAIAHYNNASNLNPKDMSLIYQIAKIHLEMKNYADCINFSAKAIKVGKENRANVKMVSKAYVMRAKAHKELGETDKFQDNIAKAVKYLKVVAQLRFDNEIWDECIDFCQRAYEMGKENDHVDETLHVLERKANTKMNEATKAEDLKKLGNEAYNMMDFDNALKHYHEAKKLNPREITYLNNIAAVKLEEKKYDECIKVCDEAINIGKKMKKNRADPEKIEKARDRKRRAQKLLQKAKSEAEISEMLHKDLKMGGDMVDIIEEAEERHSNHWRAKHLLAEELGVGEKDIPFHLTDARFRASGKHTQRPIDPCHLRAAEEACNKGDEAYNKRDFDAALKHYLRAKKLNPREIIYLHNIAAVKLEQKKYEQCMNVCDEAMNIGKKDPANLSKIEKILDLRDIANKFFVDQMERQVRRAIKEDDKSPCDESKEFRLMLKLNGLDDKLEHVSESARDYIEREVESKLLKAEENAHSQLPETFEGPTEFHNGLLRYFKDHELSPLHPTVLLEVSKALSEKKNYKGCATLMLYTFDQLPGWTDER